MYTERSEVCASVCARQRVRSFRCDRIILFALVILCASLAVADAAPATTRFNIEAQEARKALALFARQARVQLGYAADVVDDILTNPVNGEYENAQALEILLEGTGLEALYGEKGITIRPVPKREVGGDIEERTPPVAQTNSLRFAQASAAEVHAMVGQNQTVGTGTDSGEGEEKRRLEEIVVTGTNIRGVSPDSSPTRTFTREDVQISGAATAQDFIQTLTTNFGGGSNADIPGSLPGDSNTGFNNVTLGALGSSVNLRGLGSGATLVLLNGHRVAPSSGIGDFTDISMIPASAIERVEVLNDGASSIYGGDAIAGVVNFILRDDFEGLETSFRYGIGTQRRSPEEFRASATGGLNWDTGHALLVYEHFNQDQIGAADRAFSQDALEPNYLQPSQKRHSVLVSLSQDLTENLETFADVTFSNRDAVAKFTTVPTEPNISMPSWKTLSASAGGTRKISESWFVDLAGSYSNTQGTTTIEGILPFVRNPSINDIDSNLWALDLKASGTLFDLLGGELRLAIGGQYRKEEFVHTDVDDDEIVRDADRDVYAVFGEALIPIIAPDNNVRGVERLEVNVSGRLDDYSDFGTTVNPKVGIMWSPVEAANLRGSYSTSFNPPALGLVGASDFEVVLVPRSFINSAFGFTPADPSIADVTELFVAGTDKDLEAETSRTFTAGLDFNKDFRHHSLAFSVTYFDIEFEGRLGITPVPGGLPFNAPNIAFNNPDLFPSDAVIFAPTQDQINGLIENADNVSFLLTTEDDIPNTQIITAVNVTRNNFRTLTSGYDFELAYTHESGVGAWTLGLDATILKESKRQAIVTTPLVEELNTLYHPVDLKLRGQAGYDYNGFSTSIFVNYTDDYAVDSTIGAMAIDSWTTVDLSIAYDIQRQFGRPLLDDTVLRLSAINLLDNDPPSTISGPPFTLIQGYDPANASPLGRFVAFEVTMKF